MMRKSLSILCSSKMACITGLSFCVSKKLCRFIRHVPIGPSNWI